MLQTAVTLVLLVAAGLLTRSILQAQRVDLGFRADGAVALGTELGLVGYDEAKRAARCSNGPPSASRAIPGVHVGVARRAAAARDQLQPQQRLLPRPDAARTIAARRSSATWVDDTLLRARSAFRCCAAATSRPATRRRPAKVAIVNEAFVKRYWPGRGRSRPHASARATADGPEFEVVGVVADYKVETVGEKPTPYIHYALGQRAFTGEVLIARTATDAGRAARRDAPRGARARAERRLPRQPDDGSAGGGDAAAGAPRGADARPRRPRRHAARRGRPLRRHRLRRGPAHARDRHPHGARRDARATCCGW